MKLGRPDCGTAIFLACLVFATSTWAAETGDATNGLERLLQTEISGASRYEQPLAEAPASASVLTAEDFRRYGFRDIGEALQTMRGVYLTQDRTYGYMGVRGFNRPGDYNSRILLLVDGFSVNNPIYDQAMIGNEAPLDVDWIKRLEFVPGAASANYGGNALFGIVNAVRWNGGDLEGTRAALDVGSGGARRLSLMSGQRLEGGGDWLAGVVAYRRSGEDLTFPEYRQPGGGGGIAHGLDGERYVKTLLKGNWGGWSASFTSSDRVKDVPIAYYGTVFDASGNTVEDREYHLDLGHATTLAPQLAQHLRLHVGSYGYTGRYPYADYRYRDEVKANWWTIDGQWQWTGWADHRVLMGLELREYQRLWQRAYMVAPRQVDLDHDHDGHAHGVFVQDEWRISSQWLLNLGARVDRQNTVSSITSPRGALIWRPGDTVSFKWLAGKAFRAPNDYELYYGDGGVSQRGNPDLRPERIRSQEIGMDLSPTEALRFSVGHYRYRIQDLIEQQTDAAGLWVFMNRPDVRAQGWELETEALLGGGWRVRGNMAWQTLDHPDGAPVNMPRHLGKLLIDGPVPGLKATLGLNLQAVSSRRTIQGRVGGYVTGNVVLRQQGDPTHGLFSLAIYNVTDKRYRDPVGPELSPIDAIERDGRQWRLQWEIGFR
jgi:iron complex outermembrane receptor protein